MHTTQNIYSFLETISDPEIPVLSIVDLGVVREIKIKSNTEIEIFITPTYSGCPAMQMISTLVKVELAIHGYKTVDVTEVLSPAWTTDWMTEKGKQKLKEYGIAPPSSSNTVHCPQCNSTNTQLISEFGSTSCKSLYKCLDCLEPFDYFKCH